MTVERPLIVAVDDDDAVNELLQDLLSDEGYHVISCRKDAAALAVILEAAPDLVLLDLRFLREGYDWTILRSMRRDERTAKVSVIGLTVDMGPSEAQHWELEQLRCELLLKPFETEELLIQIRQMLRRAREVNGCSA
jgi:DNA-binding response OmpR family regulator